MASSHEVPAESPSIAGASVLHWRRDAKPPPPEVFEQARRDDLGSEPIAKDVYYSRAHHAREVQGVWKHVWQMACRERALKDVGDFITYEVADQSVLIVRDAPGHLSAFHNVCLHRGTRLAQGSGNVGRGGTIQCSFHGWTWNIDGSLERVPCRWDFPEVIAEEYALGPVQVATWDGWVFVNFDLEAPGLDEYLGPTILRHFERWRMGERRVVAHVARVLPANWKVAIEAFLETYHVFRTHPQAVAQSFDAAAQYDQFGIHSRMMMAGGAASPHLPEGLYSEDEVLAAAMEFRKWASEAPLAVPAGSTARAVLAENNRAQMGEQYDFDFSRASDAEMLDTIEYVIFPNFVPWVNYSPALVYRVRPYGQDPERCFFEVMLTGPQGEGADDPDAELEVLPDGATWADAPSLGYLGPVLDQDTPNVCKVQLGLHSDGLKAVSLARYQEANIRLIHHTIREFIDMYDGST